MLSLCRSLVFQAKAEVRQHAKMLLSLLLRIVKRFSGSFFGPSSQSQCLPASSAARVTSADLRQAPVVVLENQIWAIDRCTGIAVCVCLWVVLQPWCAHLVKLIRRQLGP
jgi:hypothetical protein